ncbi:hypothetical protein C772_01490 [Bhargavaea cecembensis DSE10]|uniref:Small-conductance mechanosensitive channel n=1 Tax=Bhargavaea cecembensis DSE10 TaxID=1235279 RepID=M7NY34_9BACL|nr:hypothetical protein [Bhargavaea cecembensis]EMR06595.1 hypothetical protein C772_01490 [Bhargavaea cecembensis DSE10]
MSVSKELKSSVAVRGAAREEAFSFTTFQDKSHFWGRLTLWGIILLTFSLPMILSFGLGYHPGWSAILSGFLAYASIIAVVWVVEPISYYPILGVSGTYLAFLNGNIGNMCLPSASVAQTAVGAEPGTEKGELTATLAIAAAAIINTSILVLVVLGGSYLISLLPAALVDTFKFVLPAIYGGVIAQFAIQKPVWGLIGIAFGLFVNLGPVPQSLQTFLCIFGTVAACILLEKIKSEKAGDK